MDKAMDKRKEDIRLKEVVELLRTQYHILDGIIIEFKNIKWGGRARIKTGKITIPSWVFNYSLEFQKYYIIHECTHFITGLKHDEHFKKEEEKILKEFGISIEYNKAYAATLKDLSGKVTYTSALLKSGGI